MPDGNKLQLDKTSTPEKEAEDFENVDDLNYRLKKINNDHELGLFKARLGTIGKLIGAGESATVNFCVILIIGLFLIMILLGIGIAFSIDQFVEPLKLAFTALLTVSGYIFGKKT